LSEPIEGLNLKADGIFIDLEPHVLSHLQIDVTPRDLVRQIKTSCNRPEILRSANRTLGEVKNIWNPSIIYRWCEIQPGKSDNIGTIQNSGNVVDIDFGYSIKFLTHVSHALVAVYTTGQELEAVSKKLCSLLSLEKINVNIREDAILSLFKTVSCLIGLGPGYDTDKVGSICQVCSKNHDCQMKHA
jgi:hypothetical protein